MEWARVVWDRKELQVKELGRQERQLGFSDGSAVLSRSRPEKLRRGTCNHYIDKNFPVYNQISNNIRTIAIDLGKAAQCFFRHGQMALHTTEGVTDPAVP